MEKVCPNCNAPHEKSGIFCCRSCANRRVHTEESKKKLSNTTRGRVAQNIGKQLIQRFEYNYECIICKKPIFASLTKKAAVKKRKTCGRLCFLEAVSRGSRKTAAKQLLLKRSKNEILFSELCSEKYSIICNAPIFDGWDADVILVYEKIAILWNGKWHYEKLTKQHSLEQVQNRDKLKEKAILQCGYTPYVIKDMGGFNPIFVNEKFGELVNWLSRGPHKAK